MSENRPDDARTPGTRREPADPQETQETQETRVVETSGDTQVLPRDATRVLPTPGHPGGAATAPVAAPEHDDEPEAQRSDVPLAVFDEPGPLLQAAGPGRPDASPASPYPTPYLTEPAPGYAPAYGQPGSATPGPQRSADVPAGGPGPQAAPGPYVPYGPAGPLPAPPVSTTPRTGTIVWGLVILAVGLALAAVAAGARFDVGLGLIWLLGGAGLVLVVASVVGGVRRRNRADA
jgi:hypothetical protein